MARSLRRFRPATSMVELIDPALLVEIEAGAVIL